MQLGRTKGPRILMLWNRDHTFAHDRQPLDPRRVSTGRRLRRSVSAGVVAIILLSLAVPFSGVAAAGKTGRTLLAEWSAVSTVSVVQQSSTSISYRGIWRTASNAGYMDGRARATKARAAKASLRFTGAAIAWVGPVGPSRGKARVYIDGRLVTTVNTWASIISREPHPVHEVLGHRGCAPDHDRRQRDRRPSDRRLGRVPRPARRTCSALAPAPTAPGYQHSGSPPSRPS